MGRDKAALTLDGESLLDRACRIVRPHVRVLAVVGASPSSVKPAPAELHLRDIPCVRGPIAGIVAALEHDPRADWLVLGCDMPAVGAAAIEWLIGHHRSAAASRPDATLAQLPDRDRPEPLLAIYAPSSAPALRNAVAGGGSALQAALGAMRCAVHEPPGQIARCWLNVNTPEDWRKLLETRGSTLRGL